MTIRAATLLTAVTLAITSPPAPARAQADPHPPSPAPTIEALAWEGQWEGAWDDEVTYSGVWTGTYRADQDEARDKAGFAEDGWGGYRAYRRSEDDERRVGRLPHGLPERTAYYSYSPRERALWLEDCQAELLGDAYYSPRGGDRRGGVLGGLLGAVTGGLIGNRIAAGERLAGTLIGAGVGGLAGAAIGGAIDAASRRDRLNDAEQAYRHCEDYLTRYEREWSRSYGYAPMAGGPVTTTYRYAPVRERVVEEWVEEEVAAEAPPTAPSKRVRMNR